MYLTADGEKQRLPETGREILSGLVSERLRFVYQRQHGHGADRFQPKYDAVD